MVSGITWTQSPSGFGLTGQTRYQLWLPYLNSESNALPEGAGCRTSQGQATRLPPSPHLTCHACAGQGLCPPQLDHTLQHRDPEPG